MTNRQRVEYEGSADEKRRWSARYAEWKCVLDQAAAEWQNFRAAGGFWSGATETREYIEMRDRAARALLAFEDPIDDDTLRTLQSIAWQTKAIFGSAPPVVRMVEEELECRGHFPQFLHLPAWFTNTEGGLRITPT